MTPNELIDYLSEFNIEHNKESEINESAEDLIKQC